MPLLQLKWKGRPETLLQNFSMNLFVSSHSWCDGVALCFVLLLEPLQIQAIGSSVSNIWEGASSPAAVFLAVWAWIEKVDGCQLAKQIEIAVHDSNISSKKTKHKTFLSLSLTEVPFGNSSRLLHAYFPLVREDSFNYVAMQDNTVQPLALLIY